MQSKIYFLLLTFLIFTCLSYSQKKFNLQQAIDTAENGSRSHIGIDGGQSAVSD